MCNIHSKLIKDLFISANYVGAMKQSSHHQEVWKHRSTVTKY